MRIATILGSTLIACALVTPVRADFLVFSVPTTSLKFVLQGKAVSSRTLPTINFTSHNKQVFDLPQTPDTEVITVPPLNQIGAKHVLKAKGDAEKLREAAAWTLDHGLLPEFHRALDQLAAANASDAFATEAKRLKAELAKPLPDETPESLKGIAPEGFQTSKSPHFLLFHGPTEKSTDKTEIKRKKPEHRLEELERLLEIFVMKCAERGLAVQVPASRLRVIALNRRDPRMVATGRTPATDSRILWAPDSNILFFKGEEADVTALEGLKKLQNTVAKIASQPKTRPNNNAAGGGQGRGNAPAAGMAYGGGSGAGDLSQLSATNLAKLTVAIQALMVIGVENADLESTSRESAYMFIANCGVVPPQAPQWVRDGLAAYFEYPSEVGWVKIGDLGHVRNAWYQASLQDPDLYGVGDIITGRCHELPMSAHEAQRAGNLSWALMHFLMQKRPAELAQYLNGFRAVPPDVDVNPDLLDALFTQSFGADPNKVEEEWRQHMTEIKAEYLVIKEEEGDGGSKTTEN